MSDKYITTIGLEIHAELKTKTKMFSNSKNDPDEVSPNVNVTPIDLGHPGTLPTINKEAVKQMIRIGCAVGGEIANFTEFDRKNYFYPDIPKGYQITQFKYPIVSGGELNGVKLTRIHLEEDTGTNKHDKGNFSLVDFNRAGIPLMELVTEPVIHSADEAVAFARELQLLLRYLGAGDANIEKGEMRIEVNISISDDPNKLGTKVEIKNLGSFKVVEKSIKYEIERMTKLLESGRGEEIVQETRGFDETKDVTFSQRKKESSDDYRYFPEPDLPKLMLHELFDIEAIRADLPTLPWEKRNWYKEAVGLSDEAVAVLLYDQKFGEFFDEVVALKQNEAEKIDENKDWIKKAANYITSDLVALLGDGGDLPKSEHFRTLIDMIVANDVSSRGAKDLLALLVKDSVDPKNLAKEKGLLQESNEEELLKMVGDIIAGNPDAVAEFKSGKEASMQFLVGQGMKLSRGSANPQLLREMLVKELS